MECKDVEAVLEQEGLSPLPADAREHLADCESCRGFLAGLSAILVTAKTIPAEENPPERVWVSLRAQLEAEGIIREPQVVAGAIGAAPWWEGFVQLLRPRTLAMVSAGILVVVSGVYFSNHHTKVGAPAVATTAPPVATKPAEAPQTEIPGTVKAAAPTLSAENAAKKPAGRAVAAEANKPSPIRESKGELQPSPSELASFGESAAVLDQTERFVPSGANNNAAVEAALRENLRTLNEFIAECKTRLKENPRDQLTQEYLNMALQQKAELLNAMMDSGRSEH